MQNTRQRNYKTETFIRQKLRNFMSANDSKYNTEKKVLLINTRRRNAKTENFMKLYVFKTQLQLNTEEINMFDA